MDCGKQNWWVVAAHRQIKVQVIIINRCTLKIQPGPLIHFWSTDIYLKANKAIKKWETPTIYNAIKPYSKNQLNSYLNCINIKDSKALVFRLRSPRNNLETDTSLCRWHVAHFKLRRPPTRAAKRAVLDFLLRTTMNGARLPVLFQHNPSLSANSESIKLFGATKNFGITTDESIQGILVM